MREFRHVLRRLRSSPAFTIAATLTLAIAIGATASLYSIVDGVLLKAFPYREADRVLAIRGTNEKRKAAHQTISAPNFLDYRSQSTAFAMMAAAKYAFYTVTGAQDAERLSARSVTPEYFLTLGVTPVAGRFLAPDSAGPAEVVISYGFWQRRFGGAPSAIGHTLTLDDWPYTIVGVMPAGVVGDVDLWTRLSFNATDVLARSRINLDVFGRLAPGVTAVRAQHQLEIIADRLAKAYPNEDKGKSIRTIPLVDELVGRVRPALLALLAAAGCVLLIGAANLANLFLARHLARERELSIRFALGASRGRLTRELTLEALTLASVGCLLGVGLATVGTSVLRALAPENLPRLDQVGVDGRVVAFSVLASLIAVLLFGVLPAWNASRRTSAVRHHRVQNALVVVQVAVALVLLTGAGLFVESFAHFRRLDPGFRPDGVLTAQITPAAGRYATPEQHARFIDAVANRLSVVPGVQMASVSSNVPAGPYTWMGYFTIIGDPAPDPSDTPTADLMCVTPEFFRTMGVTLRRGRGVLPTDDFRAPGVVVVDELVARRYFPGRDPIGQRMSFGDTVAVVGVVSAVRHHGLATDEAPLVYAPFAQCPSPFAFVEVRASGDPLALTTAVKRAIAAVDPTVPVSDVKTMSARVAQSVGNTTFSAFLASLFAVVALLLGVIGIYSVLAYIVAQRRREIGVRLALGATHGHVIANVLRHALALTGIGILLGSATAWWVTRALSGLFLGVSPHDPAAFLGAAGLFTGVALIAASVPAFRTTRVNPAVVLS